MRDGGKGGRGKEDRDNINYLVKIITEKFLSASDVCQIPFFFFFS